MTFDQQCKSLLRPGEGSFGLCLGDRQAGRERQAQAVTISSIANPASLAILTLGILIGLSGLEMPDVDAFAQNFIKFLFSLCVGWFLFNLVDLIDLGESRVSCWPMSRRETWIRRQLVV